MIDISSVTTEDLDGELDLMDRMGLPTQFSGRISSKNRRPREDNEAALKAFDRYWKQNGEDIVRNSWRDKFPDQDIDDKDNSEVFVSHCTAMYDETCHLFLRKYNRGRIWNHENSNSMEEDNASPEEHSASIKTDNQCDCIPSETSSQDQPLSAGKKSNPHNRPPPDLPKKLYGFWRSRYHLFSRFDEGIRLDSESYYSVTPEKIAIHQARRCVTYSGAKVIIDGFCGAGGNTIQFALAHPDVRVIAVDIDPVKIELAKNNAAVYGVLNQIEFIVGNFMEVVPHLKGDVVFMSPPWGGPNYRNIDVFKLIYIEPNLYDAFNLIRQHITQEIGLLIPRMTDDNDLRELAGEGNSVEIEMNYFKDKEKTKTAYYGKLISNNRSSSTE